MAIENVKTPALVFVPNTCAENILMEISKATKQNKVASEEQRKWREEVNQARNNEVTPGNVTNYPGLPKVDGLR